MREIALVAVSTLVGLVVVVACGLTSSTPDVTYVELEANRGGVRCYLFQEQMVLFCEAIPEN